MKRWIAIGILLAACLGLLFIWASTNIKLELTTVDLASTQTQLDSVRTQVATTQAELVSTQTELASTQDKLTSTQTELEGIKDELTDINAELADLQTSYDGLLTGHGYSIKDPTYKEMLSFISSDKTDQRQYVEGEYICLNFAMDVCNSAEEKGIRCAYVSLWYPNEQSHAIIAFNTIDKGLIYIEPQSDELVEPVIGKYFWKCVIPKPGYYYEKPSYDDTIEKIFVAW